MSYAWESEPDIDVRVIKVNEAKFLKMPDGQIVLVWDESVFAVGKILRALPVSDPWRYLIVYDTEGNEVGVILDFNELDINSKAILKEELEQRYRTPKILKILKVERLPQTGHTLWKVETDEGFKEFVVPGSEHIYTARYPRIFLVDENGNRYEIPNFERLDSKSKQVSVQYL